MQTGRRCGVRSRRDVLRLLGASAVSLALPDGTWLSAQQSSRKPLCGIFPIAQTPYTAADQLDLDCLVEQVKFIHRGGVHGFVWPQMASEWQSLTQQERLAGAEAIAATGRELRPAIVIGVQGPDVATAVTYARHAEKIGADAIISLPPSERSDPTTVLQYYQEVGRATDLPMFVQSAGNMSVESVLEIYRAVPTMRYVKDEAGKPLDRIIPLREKSSNEIRVFSGNHGRTLIEEMRRGSSGSCPAASFADLYAATWDLWHEGKRREAMDMHAKTLLILTEMLNHGFEAMKYILYLRGVFKTYFVRSRRGVGFESAEKTAAGGSAARSSIDEAGKRALRETLDYLQPYLRT